MHLPTPLLNSVKPHARFTKWQPTELMEWAKYGYPEVKYNLARSGVPLVEDLAEIPGGPFKPRLWGNNFSGHEGLKQTIAAMYGAAPENVLVAQGASQCNFLLAGAALCDGGSAMVESPCYQPFLRSIQVWADEVIYLPRPRERRFQPDLDEFHRRISPDTKLIMLTNLHNPSHVALAPPILGEITAAAAQVGAIVVVDEVYLRMVLPDYRQHGSSHGAVSVNSLGKTWGLDGLRVGWAVGPSDLIYRAFRLNNLLGVNQPFITEDIAYQILNSPRAVEWLQARARVAASGQKYLEALLQQVPSVDCVLPDGGISAYLRLPGETDDVEFNRRLIEQYDTVVFPGSFFGTPGTIRASFGHAPEEMSAGWQRLTKAINALT